MHKSRQKIGNVSVTHFNLLKDMPKRWKSRGAKLGRKVRAQQQAAMFRLIPKRIQGSYRKKERREDKGYLVHSRTGEARKEPLVPSQPLPSEWG